MYHVIACQTFDFQSATSSAKLSNIISRCKDLVRGTIGTQFNKRQTEVHPFHTWSFGRGHSKKLKRNFNIDFNILNPAVVIQWANS